jgi:hypothetical protein
MLRLVRNTRLISIGLTAGLLSLWSPASRVPRGAFDSIGMGTSVVIHMTAASLLVAADGRVHTAAERLVEETCKIRITKGVVFTNAGLIRRSIQRLRSRRGRARVVIESRVDR